MKLLGLLNEDTQKQLVEHLGNLDSIDKELVKALTDQRASHNKITGIGFKKDSKGEESWSDGSMRRSNAIGRRIGRDSELVDAQLGFEDAANEFNLDDVAALIYKHDGKQQLIITHTTAINTGARKASYKSPLEFTYRMTSRFVRELHATPFPGTKKTFESEFDKLTKQATGLNKTGKLDELAKVQSLLRLLAQLEWALANPNAKAMVKETAFPKLDLIVVKFDKARIAKGQERHELQKGVVPLPKTPKQVKMPNASYMTTSHNAYIRELVMAMKYKANQLRNKRATKFEQPDELLKHVIDNGYIKKIQFMGQAYDLYQNRISLDDLLLGDKGRGESYVEYKADRSVSDNPGYEKAREEFKAMRQELLKHPHASYPEWVASMEDPEKRAKAEEEFRSSWAYEQGKKLMPEVYLKHRVHPYKLRIRLVMDGGKIVPHKIEMEFSDF